MRGRYTQTTPAKGLIVALLCMCVLMQMLSVPTTLWNPQGSADLFSVSILEGYAVPPLPPLVCEFHEETSRLEQREIMRTFLFDHSLFHPPVLAS